MRRVTMLCAVLALWAGDALAQSWIGPAATTEYFLSFPTSDDPQSPFRTGFQSGARGVAGPFDLDGDGKMEVIFSEYTGGGRFYVVEAQSADNWELVYSSPWLDATGANTNGRIAYGADLDGDGMGEVYITCGNSYNFTAGEQTAPAIITGVGLCIWEAQGDNNFGTEPAGFYDFGDYQPDRTRVEQMVAMDVDKDGTVELLIANDAAANALDIYYVISVTGDIGSGLEFWTNELVLTSRDVAPDPVDRGGGSPYGLSAGDLDGDGNMELILTSYNYFNFAICNVVGPDTYDCPETDAFVQAMHPVDDVALMGGVVADINGDGRDEFFAPRLTSYPSQAVSVLSYGPGETANSIKMSNIGLDAISDPEGEVRGLTNLGITAGDVDGDGTVDLIGAGWEHIGSDQTAGDPPYFIHIASWVGEEGGDPKDPANYFIRKIPTPSAFDTTYLNVVFRDSAGVVTKFYESAGDIYFPPKVAFLGDADGDGFTEIAASFQGVDDSTRVYDEIYRENIGSAAYTIAPGSHTYMAAAGNTERDLAYNPVTDNVYVVSRASGVEVAIFDAADGTFIGTLTPPDGGYAGGTFALNHVEVTPDGQIFAINLSTTPASSPVKIYYWADEDSTGRVVFDGTLDTGARYGDSFGVFGSGDEIYVLASGGGNAYVAGWEWNAETGMLEAPEFVQVQNEAARGGFAAFEDQDGVWINGRGTEIQLVDTDDEGNTVVLASIPSALVPSSTMALTGFTINGRNFLAAGPDGDHQFWVADVTDPANPRVVGRTNPVGANANTGWTGGVTTDPSRGHLITLDTNNGVSFFPVEIGFERTQREAVAQNRIFGRIFSLGDQLLPTEELTAAPSSYELKANYPNPFAQHTQITFALQQPATVSLKVYDTMGRVVRTLVPSQIHNSGEHTVTWNGQNDAGQEVASGVYFYALDTPAGRFTKKMVRVN